MHESDTDGQSDATDDTEKISSEDLAALIVDALLRGGLVDGSDVERAVAIATEEIGIRKLFGDY